MSDKDKGKDAPKNTSEQKNEPPKPSKKDEMADERMTFPPSRSHINNQKRPKWRE